jgi:tetratricopeptide (TPR) repeat protein
MPDQLAPDSDMEKLVAALSTPGGDDLAPIDALLLQYPDDPRLHFMRGSVLAGMSDHIKAHAALSRAVEIAPEYAIARYQLGFFELTSGEADKALATWGPLLRAPKNNYLRVFVEGMAHVIRDEFEEAFAKFEKGIELNQENLPMNGDIELLMRELKAKMDAGTGGGDATDKDESDDESDATSATSLLLGQLGGNQTKH